MSLNLHSVKMGLKPYCFTFVWRRVRILAHVHQDRRIRWASSQISLVHAAAADARRALGRCYPDIVQNLLDKYFFKKKYLGTWVDLGPGTLKYLKLASRQIKIKYVLHIYRSKSLLGPYSMMLKARQQKYSFSLFFGFKFRASIISKIKIDKAMIISKIKYGQPCCGLSQYIGYRISFSRSVN